MEVQNSNLNHMPENLNNLGAEEANSLPSVPDQKVKNKSFILITILAFLLLVVSSIAAYYFLKNQEEETKEETNNLGEIGLEETKEDISEELVFEEIGERDDMVIDEEAIEITPDEFLKIEEVINPEYDPSITLEVEKTVGNYALVNKGTVGGLVGETGILKKVDGEWTIKLSFLHNWFERSCDELCQADVPLELLIGATGISRSFEFCGDIPYDEYCEINN